jgi:hypothetical protein
MLHQLHLFDANVLITASNMYYPLDGVPEFWEWIDHQARNGRIKLPVEVLEEVLAGSRKEDPLLDWMTAHKDVLRLKEKVDPSLVNLVVTEGYAPDLTDDELIEIGQDPFLIAYAIANTPERCVVTVEVSSPSKKRQNRKIPDVCNHFGVNCQNPFQVYRSLGFSTAWKKT